MYTKKNDVETFTAAMVAIDKFTWNQTPQGMEFWESVWSKLADLRDVVLEREREVAKSKSDISSIAKRLYALADELKGI